LCAASTSMCLDVHCQLWHTRIQTSAVPCMHLQQRPRRRAWQLMYVVICLCLCLCCAARQHRQSCQQSANERCPPWRPRICEEHSDRRGCRGRSCVAISSVTWKRLLGAGRYQAGQKDIWPAFSQVLGAQLVAVEVGVWRMDDLAAADEASSWARWSTETTPGFHRCGGEASIAR
jgi:hypothetical protein